MNRLFSVFLFLASTLVVAAQNDGTVIAEKVNLRGTPTGTGKIVTELNRDTPFNLMKQEGPWFLIQTKTDVGWVHGNTIKLTMATLETLGGASLADIPARPVDVSPVRQAAPISQPRPSSSSSPSSTSGYIRGSRGGCYYLNSRGNKTYVSRSLCN